MHKKLTALLMILLLLLSALPALGEEALAFVDLPDMMRPGKSVRLSFTSPTDGTADLTLLKDDDVAAHILAQASVTAGRNDIAWDAVWGGESVPEGQYTLSLTIGGNTVSQAMTIGPDSPVISQLYTSDILVSNDTPVEIYFTANTACNAVLELEQADGIKSILTQPVTQGENTLTWDGAVNGTFLEDGMYTLILKLTDDTGFSSNEEHMDVSVQATVQKNVISENVEEDLQAISRKIAPAYKSTYIGDGIANEAPNYWNTPMDITNEAAIWAMLTAPITVISGGQKDSIKLRAEPSEDSEAVAEVTCASQGVRVLENRDDGWSLVECYSSSFHDSKVKAWNAYVQGYVKTDKLVTKNVKTDSGIVVDKLAQRLYYFTEGKLLFTLMVSTGLVTDTQPYNETRSGEFLLVSAVGEFPSGNLLCSMGIRFNDGDLLHEVPHLVNADGGSNYSTTEPKLGERASHGCIRVQRKRTPDGYNMRWIWNNRTLNTRLVIWEDYTGRQLPYPDDNTMLYYNAGGAYYHISTTCNSVRDQYLPFDSSFTYGELDDEPYSELQFCDSCIPPLRVEQIDEINAAHLEAEE